MYEARQGQWRVYEMRVSIPLISILKLGTTRLLLAHRREIYGLSAREHQLVLLIIHEAVFFLLFLLVALDTGLVRVLASVTIRIDVSVFTARYAIHADCLLLVRSVVIFEAPRDRTVRIVVSISPNDLQNIFRYIIAGYWKVFF